MNLASEAETLRFLNGLWYSYGMRLVRTICQAYELNEEQTDAMEQQLLKPGDWSVQVKQPLSDQKH